jgi:sarcosine oxidase
MPSRACTPSLANGSGRHLALGSTPSSISAYRRGVTWDAVVVGLGAMGAATLAELARRGRRVLGLERFSLPHAQGSSQGGTRIIREAYFEHPLYVPLVQRAYERWQALERRTGVRLIVPTGGLTIGPPDGRLVSGALASAAAHGLAHTVLTVGEIADRHPAVRLPAGVVAVHEPRAGVLLAARAIAALLDVARRDGAEVRAGAPVAGWEAVDGAVRIVVDGETIQADRLVIAAGSWMPALVPELAADLQVERNVVHWFIPAPSSTTSGAATAFGPDHLPVLVIEDSPEHLLYALPSMRGLGDDLEDGVKFACHHSGVIAASADAVDRQPGAADVAAIRADVSRYLPGLAPEPVRSSVCTYTNTPDGHFLVDRHPRHREVILVSPCSGHGFKFASVLGELVADLVENGNVHGVLAPFAAGRYSAPGNPGPGD